MVNVNVAVAPAEARLAVTPLLAIVWAPLTPVAANVTEADVAVPLEPIVKAVPLEPSKETLRIFPPQPALDTPAPAAVFKSDKTIVATSKIVDVLYQVSVIAVVIAVSHATAAWEPCPNSKLPVPIVTLAASVVATNGPTVAIKKPAIIFLLR